MSEKKSLTEIVIMPLVVAVVGITGTLLVTQQQNRNAEIARQTQLERAEESAAAERQIKVLEIFADKIQSTNASERQFALELLKAVDGEFAEKLASAAFETEPEESVQKVAESVRADAARRGSSFPVVASTRSLAEAKTTLRKIESALKAQDIGYSPEIYLSDNGWYAVTLGGNLTRTEALARVRRAKESGVSPDAYIRTSETWVRNPST